jgi:hypothetical protein
MKNLITSVVTSTVAGVGMLASVSSKPSGAPNQIEDKSAFVPTEKSYDRSEQTKKGQDLHYFV